jgi:hypothetical protein
VGAGAGARQPRAAGAGGGKPQGGGGGGAGGEEGGDGAGGARSAEARRARLRGEGGFGERRQEEDAYQEPAGTAEAHSNPSERHQELNREKRKQELAGLMARKAEADRRQARDEAAAAAQVAKAGGRQGRRRESEGGVEGGGGARAHSAFPPSTAGSREFASPLSGASPSPSQSQQGAAKKQLQVLQNRRKQQEMQQRQQTSPSEPVDVARDEARQNLVSRPLFPDTPDPDEDGF